MHKRRGPARCDPVLLQAHHSVPGMLLSALCVCIGAFRIIIFLSNERLLIAFLVRPICHMVLPHYCAARLKEMDLHFTVYIYLCIYYLFSMNVFYNNT